MSAQRGPMAYATLANMELNSPGINFWAVDRGFVRRHLQTATASLDIGSVTDLYPGTDPFA